MKSGRLTAVVASVALAFLFAAPGVMAKQKKDQLYPHATREEPKLDAPSNRVIKQLNQGLDAANSGDAQKAEQILEPFASGAKGDSKYVQALALQGLANLKYNSGDVKSAITLLEQSIANGVLPNDTYFQLMYELTQFYVADQQYQKALTTLTKWRAEGKRETADSYALEGNIDYRLQKYPEAIAAIKKAKQLDPKAAKPSWDQLLAASYAESGNTDQAVELAKKQLAAHPDDIVTLRNAVATLIGAQKYTEALSLMQKAKAAGALKESRDWINLAKINLVVGQNSDDPAPYADKAIAAIDEGLAKGFLKPGYDVYKLQGNAANLAADDAKALTAYKKALPFAKDGEVMLRMGQILINQGKYSKGKSMVRKAIKKGVKQEGSAWMLLGAAEANSKNRSAAIAAMRKAAQFPKTRAKAQSWLRKAGAN